PPHHLDYTSVPVPVPSLPGLEDRVCGTALETVRRVERHAEVAGPERVATSAALGARALDLAERVHREPACPLEPALVARALERLQERVAVAGRAVADADALLVAVRSRAPGQLGSGQEQA